MAFDDADKTKEEGDDRRRRVNGRQRWRLHD